MPSYTARRSFGRPSRSNFSSSKPRFGGNNSGSRGRRGPKKDYIAPERFIAKAKPQVEQVPYEATHQFQDFAVEQIIKDNLAAKGFVTPSPIQDKTIPVGLEGKDIIGIANTGTGKTAAFAIPLVHRLMTEKDSRALIIAPTRELAQQIEDEARSIGKGSGLRNALLIGGSPMGPQLRDLKERPKIVIGTPGRIKDHLERGTLKLQHFNIVVLDEVDRMLDMGFITDVTTILSGLAADRQSFFFSATMDYKVRNLIDTFSADPVSISVKTNETSESVDQNIVAYQHVSQKIDKLHDILLQDHVEKVIIFDDTQRSVEKLSEELIGRGFSADAIHGGKSQGQRQRALNRFKKSEVIVLVATDVAARGIDVADVTHVINYSTPQSYEDYVHRIGRAGRAGRTGYALTFIEG